MASAYLDGRAADWYVLSAKYGLVHRDEQIGWYDETLNAMATSEIQRWAHRVWQDLQPVLTEFDGVLLIAGERYRRYLVPRIEELALPCEIPLLGMGIGRQLSWLKQQTGA
jgi:hypothetical protein